MFGSGKSFLGGLIGLFFFSIAVFFLIYFFVPEVSLKFFGIAADMDRIVNEAISDAVSASALPQEITSEITGYLETEEGKAFVAGMGESIDQITASLGSVVEAAGRFIATEDGTAADFFHSLEAGEQ